MDKKTQDLAWACLPKEARDEIRQLHFHFSNTVNKTVVREFENIFGRDNITSDTEPEEMLMVSRSEVQDRFNTFNNPNWASNEEEAYGAQLVIDTLDLLFGDKCLPDKEPFVQVESKFKVGDKVKIKGVAGYDVIEGISLDGYILSGETEPYLDTDLEPYTEPETKDNINMEEKELNLCELLKGCEGEGFFSLMFGEVTFEKIIEEPNLSVGEKPIVTSAHRYLPNAMYGLDGVPTLFPSRALYEKYPLDAYSAWMEWKSERTPKRWRAKEGEIYWLIPTDGSPIVSNTEHFTKYQNKLYEFGNYFRTEELAQQAAEAVRECLMKIHKQTAK